MGVSIRDVAKRAGVSIATVSRTFTIPQKVTPLTRNKVIKAAKELDFTISRSASSLKSGRSFRLAFLTGGEIESWYDSNILSGLNSILHDAGYDIALYTVSDISQRKAFFSDMSIKRNADAVLVVSFQIAKDEAEGFKATKIPLLGINTDPMEEFTASIVIDNAKSMKLIIEYLAKLGHKNIAYLCVDPDLENFRWNGKARLNGFFEACRSVSAEIHPTIIYAPKDHNRADSAFSQLACMPNKPTAIVCMNDEYAIPLIFRMQQSGWSIPEDISVVGFDDSTYAQEIGLTTVHQDPKEMGRATARILLKLLSGATITNSVQVEPSFLIVRNTVAQVL